MDFIKLVEPKSKWVIKQSHQEETMRNAMSRGGVGSMTPAKETAERREKHKAARGVKTKGMGEAYVVNQADKTANTPAYQGYKEGKKNKLTGEPLYKKGKHERKLSYYFQHQCKTKFL